MNRQAFESVATRWPGTMSHAAVRIGAPVAKQLSQEPSSIYLANLPYQRFDHDQDHTQPPEQVWCSHPHRDGTAFVITSPKVFGLWSGFDNIGVLLGSFAELLLHDEPGFRSRQIETPEAFAYILGPYAFTQSVTIEWITASHWT